MVRGSPSDADRALMDALEHAGFRVSHAQLERWRSFGVLPGHSRRYLGRGKGSSSSLDPEIRQVAEAIVARVAGTRPIQEVTLRVFLECPQLPLAERAVKASLVWFADRKIRSAYREASDAVGDRPAMTDADEDMAAQRIIDHYKSLRKPVRTVLEENFPGASDLATGAILGLGSIGQDRLVEIIDDLDPTGTESVATAFRDAAGGDLGMSLAEQPSSIASVYRAEYQKKVIRGADMANIVDARNLLTGVAAGTRMLNILHIALPDNEIVNDTIDVLQKTFVLRALLLMYPASADPIDDWAPQTKNLIMLLVLDNARGMYRMVNELYGKLFDEHLADLTAEAMDRIQAADAD